MRFTTGCGAEPVEEDGVRAVLGAAVPAGVGCALAGVGGQRPAAVDVLAQHRRRPRAIQLSSRGLTLPEAANEE